jgi:lysyl-tRNA synthetase class II
MNVRLTKIKIFLEIETNWKIYQHILNNTDLQKYLCADCHKYDCILTTGKIMKTVAGSFVVSVQVYGQWSLLTW